VPSAVRVFSEVMGEAVELPDKPKRIVSLSPSITETLFEMGLGDRVAGVTVYCHRPPEAMLKPRVASTVSFSTVSLGPLTAAAPSHCWSRKPRVTNKGAKVRFINLSED